MPDWLLDLIGWILLFVALFFWFRSRQNRKKDDD